MASSKKNCVSIPLSQEMKKCLQASEGDYAALLNAFLGPTDRAMTYLVRYPGVFMSVATGVRTPGPVINFMADTNPVSISVRVLFLFCCAVASFSNAYYESKQQDQRSVDNLAAYRNTTAGLHEKLRLESKEQKSIHENTIPVETHLNSLIETLLKESAELNKKYSSIQFTDKEIIFQKKGEEPASSEIEMKAPNLEVNEPGEDEDAPLLKHRTATSKEKNLKYHLWDRLVKYYLWQRLINDFVIDTVWKTIWEGGGTAAFVFWIMWITAAVSTAQLETSIAGMPIWAVVAIPVLAYALPKLYVFARQVWDYHFNNEDKLSWSDFKEQQKLKAEVSKDLDPLMKKLMAQAQYEANEAALLKQLGREKQDVPAQKPSIIVKSNAEAHAGIVFLTHSAASWAKTQNVAWFTVVFAQALGTSLAIPFLGHALLAIALVYGVVDAYRRYHEVKSCAVAKTDGTGKTVMTLEAARALKKDLEDKLVSKKDQIARDLNFAKGKKLHIAPMFVVQPPKTRWERVKSWARSSDWFTVLDNGMTGVLVGRLSFVVGTAFFMPFAALALASNPFTIGLIVSVGLAYVGLKWYEAVQVKREEDAKKLPDELEQLRRDNRLADLTLDNIVKARAAASEVVNFGVASKNTGKANDVYAHPTNTSSNDSDHDNGGELMPLLRNFSHSS